MNTKRWRSALAGSLPPRRSPSNTNPAPPPQTPANQTPSNQTAEGKGQPTSGTAAPQNREQALQNKADAIKGADNTLTDENLKILPLLNDELNRRLDQQWDTISQLDTKATGLVTFGVGATGLLVSHHMTVIAYFAVVTYAISFVCTFACLAVRRWSTAPAPGLLAELEHADAALSYDWLIRAKAKSFLESDALLVRKADWLKIATWSMLIPAVLTVIRFLN